MAEILSLPMHQHLGVDDARTGAEKPRLHSPAGTTDCLRFFLHLLRLRLHIPRAQSCKILAQATGEGGFQVFRRSRWRRLLRNAPPRSRPEEVCRS
jgi:hypothetical protein